MKNIILLIFVTLFNIHLTNLYAQANIEWQKCYGGSVLDYANDIKQTFEGGYIVTGYSNSNDSNVSGNHGSEDYWVVKLKSTGAIQWQKSLGGISSDISTHIIQAKDRGFVIVGNASSNDDDISGNHGSKDLWVVKLTYSGALDWQKCYGGSNDESAWEIQQTLDSGYIITGFTKSNDGDVYGNHGEFDFWVIKISSNGVLQWQKCIGGAFDDVAYSIQQTNDSGYIVAGSTLSNNGDVSGNHGSTDAWIVKLNSIGNIQWQKCYGGDLADVISSIQQTSDGGYISSGSTASSNYDVAGYIGGGDFWVLKLDSAGNIQWQKCLGGTQSETSYSLTQTIGGAYVFTGFTTSTDINVSGNNGLFDFWVIQLNSSGNIDWQKCLGGSGEEKANSIIQTTDGGFVIAGYTKSNNGDVSGNKGNSDYWVVKLSPTSGIENIETPYINIYPNPASATFEISNLHIDSKLNIYDMQGKLIYSKYINERLCKFNTEHFKNGIYLIQNEINGKIINKKLIVNK
ncbi:MAG: T9SS type A sorting domain-containing protein [Bacteroidia bacterium]|nr:T9SS type A sorting domain-containing protein [Bacteroidia bacterium]